MQRSRRQDPYPLTWEVPVAATVLVALVLVLAAHLARAITIVLVGGPWSWPPRAELFRSLPALLRGDATAGLAYTTTAMTPGTTVGPETLWGGLVVTEVVTVLLMAVLAKQTLDRWGPGRVRGMATRSEVEQLLGRSRLRRTRATIRPDLYPHHGHRLRRDLQHHSQEHQQQRQHGGPGLHPDGSAHHDDSSDPGRRLGSRLGGRLGSSR